MNVPITLDVSTDERLLEGVLVIARRSARQLVDDDTAQDVAQDVAIEFLAALREGTLERKPRSLEAFAARRAWSRARDARRGDANRRLREIDWAVDTADSTHCWMQPDLALGEAELAEVQQRTLEALTPACRRVFTMVREGEFSYEEAARTLGVSRSTICLHVSEARRRFRHELHAYGRANVQCADTDARSRRTQRAFGRQRVIRRPTMDVDHPHADGTVATSDSPSVHRRN